MLQIHDDIVKKEDYNKDYKILVQTLSDLGYDVSHRKVKELIDFLPLTKKQ
jgi:hypothetical protein